MNRRPVKSSHIASLGWHEGEDGQGVLEVEFRSGGIYRYTGVSQHTYEEFLGATSPGKYFNNHIIGEFDERAVR